MVKDAEDPFTFTCSGITALQPTLHAPQGRTKPVHAKEDEGQGGLASGLVLARLAEKAEAGFDLNRLRRRAAGRPRIGSAPAESLSVRFPPELRHQLHQRTEAEHVSEADIIRRAVAEHLTHIA